jgi:hypothetical protein
VAVAVVEPEAIPTSVIAADEPLTAVLETPAIVGSEYVKTSGASTADAFDNVTLAVGTLSSIEKSTDVAENVIGEVVNTVVLSGEFDAEVEQPASPIPDAQNIKRDSTRCFKNSTSFNVSRTAS